MRLVSLKNLPGGLLAMVFPATSLLRAILAMLLFAALGYAIWLSWYVSRNKRQRMENGKWSTEGLRVEDERARKCVSLCRIIFLGIIGAACAFYFIFGNPVIYLNNAKLKKALSTLDSGSVTLEEIVPFEWTSAYTFDPYTSIDFIEWATGSRSPALRESYSEGMTHVVFTDNGQVVASVCAYPASLGYYLTFAGVKATRYADQNGGYYCIKYGDEIVFEVMQEEGFVRLDVRDGE